MRYLDALSGLPDHVLCVGAHPEDIDVHAAGTVARLVKRGSRVSYLLCTRGNRGSADCSLSKHEVAATREPEQRQAAALLGVGELIFLEHDDGDLRFHQPQLRQEIVRVIRALRPGAIITHDPFPGDGSHDACALYPDHLVTGSLTFDAAFLAAGSHLHYPEQLEEGLEPQQVPVLYLIMGGAPDAYVDVSGEIWEQRVRAIACHQSQGRNRPENQNLLQTIAAERGRRSGFPLAEAFRVLVPG